MREIKFRGKSKKTGEWLYGDYLKFNNAMVIIPHINVEEIDVEKLEIIPGTLGQYTGFKDANGREIYEWDPLKIQLQNGYFWKGIVKYHRGAFVFMSTLGWFKPLAEIFEKHKLEKVR